VEVIFWRVWRGLIRKERLFDRYAAERGHDYYETAQIGASDGVVLSTWLLRRWLGLCSKMRLDLLG
jgi:hypothetical protein